ncbi:Dot/Icm secretion system protein IcmQ [Legionella sp. CNM-4043-24]|uniref:Dot/Icm secretion system protein IcmQ n=1 Tax=Legionella sp. CNM-4043-24 TaxID=3421646 RepID=UPI00403A7D94
MKDELTDEQAREILDALDRAITKGPWEESNFLRLFGKKLRELREEFATQMVSSDMAAAASTEARQARQDLVRGGQQLVYVALYSSEGSMLISWERIIANLSRQVLSRPIYAEEHDVQFMIRSKENRINEAYLAIYVDNQDVLTLTSDKTPRDKFGKPLMTLKDRALKIENISHFVHNGLQYNYVKNRLVKAVP